MEDDSDELEALEEYATMQKLFYVKSTKIKNQTWVGFNVVMWNREAKVEFWLCQCVVLYIGPQNHGLYDILLTSHWFISICIFVCLLK